MVLDKQRKYANDFAQQRAATFAFTPVRMANDGGKEDDGHHDTNVIEKTRQKTQKPNLYKVLLLNDDYTPMDFVVKILRRFFGKSVAEAEAITLHVHHKGVGVCGIFPYEVAETKVSQVLVYARENEHPLQCTMEKE